MPEVIVIHSSADDTFVDRVGKKLDEAQITSWVDHNHCTGPRDEWESQTAYALNTAECGIFILSSKSSSLSSARYHCQLLVDANKHLYIASIDSAQIDDFPAASNVVHYIDLTRDFEAGMAQIIQSIRSQSDPDNTPAVQIAKRSIDQTITGKFPRWHTDLALVGRDVDLNQIERSLGDGYRATCILGPSGVGKSRLAVEVAIRARFRDGVIWHEMNQYSTVADLTTQIKLRLGLPTETSADDTWARLGEAQMLIILDGLDVCHAPEPYIERLDMLDLRSGCRVLLTSRIRWPALHDVNYYELHVPDAASAMAILRAMIKRENPAYSLRGYEEALISKAHRRPKLIWYAVRWAGSYPPDYILEILETQEGDDAREVFDDMVKRSLEPLQKHPEWSGAYAALQRLAVCAGGFNFDAARHLIKEPRWLKLLQEWGLIAFDRERSRYYVDPMLLAGIPRDAAARQAHFEHFSRFAETYADIQEFAKMSAEMGNLVAAYEYAIQNNNFEAALRLALTCSEFMAHQGEFDLRKGWFEQIAARLKAANHGSATPKDATHAEALIGVATSYLERLTGHRRTNVYRAIEAYERAGRFFTQAQHPDVYCRLQVNLAMAYRHLAEIEDPLHNYQKALTLLNGTLRHYKPNTTPIEFAVVQNAIGGTYLGLATAKQPKENLWKALTALRMGLAPLNTETAPVYYALIQNNLGIAYTSLAEVDKPEKRQDNLTKAAEAFENAIRMLGEKRAPMQFAQSLFNVGNVYRMKANLYGEPDHLRKAAKVYEWALRHWTEGRAPMRYALAQSRLAFVRMELSLIEDRKQNLQKAEDAFECALKYIKERENFAEYVKLKVLLGIVRQRLQKRREAITCWADAEKQFRAMGMHDMADRMRRWISGDSEPGEGRWGRPNTY